jgi:hypothetical protein
VLLLHDAQGLTDGVVAFTDATLPDHDAAATALVQERIRAFLAGLG